MEAVNMKRFEILLLITVIMIGANLALTVVNFLK
jgi:hypothetical protein